MPVLTKGFITVAQEIIYFVTSYLRNEETLDLIYYLVKEFGKALVKILINIVATILKILTRGLIDLLTTVTNTIFDWLPEKIKGLFDANYKRKNDLTEERKKLQNELDSNLNILSDNTRRLEYDAYAPKDILKKENDKLREKNNEIRLRLIVIDDKLQKIEQKINFEKVAQKTDDFTKSFDKYVDEIADSFTSLFQEEQHQQEQQEQEQQEQEEHHQEQQEQQEKIFNVTKALKDIGNKIVDKEYNVMI